MQLASNSFNDNSAIPAEYAFCAPDAALHCTLGANRNPHLSWRDVPAGAKSLVLICHDADVPSKPDDVNQEGRIVPATLPRVNFFHWVLVDVPPQMGEIAAGTFSGEVTVRGKAGPHVPHDPHGARQGINDYTQWFAADKDMSGDYFGYDGPCPPWNDSIVHHYVFTLYALDVHQCDVSGKFTGTDVRNAIKGHVLAEATLTGLYTLNPAVTI